MQPWKNFQFIISSTFLFIIPFLFPVNLKLPARKSNFCRMTKFLLTSDGTRQSGTLKSSEMVGKGPAIEHEGGDWGRGPRGLSTKCRG